MKITQLGLPAYDLNKEPDFNVIGLQIEAKIGESFPKQCLGMRGISLADHPGKSAEDMQYLILKHGTDRYDPNRKGVHHEMDEKFGIELHIVPIKYDGEFLCPHYQGKAREGLSVIGSFLEDFYLGAKIDRGYPLRIDLLLFYELDKLEVVQMKWLKGRAVHTKLYLAPRDSSCFRFKEPEKKQEALVGLIHLGK